MQLWCEWSALGGKGYASGYLTMRVLMGTRTGHWVTDHVIMADAPCLQFHTAAALVPRGGGMLNVIYCICFL